MRDGVANKKTISGCFILEITKFDASERLSGKMGKKLDRDVHLIVTYRDVSYRMHSNYGSFEDLLQHESSG